KIFWCRERLRWRRARIGSSETLWAGHLLRLSVVSGTVRGLALQGGQGLAAPIQNGPSRSLMSQSSWASVPNLSTSKPNACLRIGDSARSEARAGRGRGAAEQNIGRIGQVRPGRPGRLKMARLRYIDLLLQNPEFNLKFGLDQINRMTEAYVEGWLASMSKARTGNFSDDPTLRS